MDVFGMGIVAHCSGGRVPDRIFGKRKSVAIAKMTIERWMRC
jgi:hypothetical protein